MTTKSDDIPKGYEARTTMSSSFDDHPSPMARDLLDKEHEEEDFAEDDDEEEEDSLWHDLKSAWKQHLVALLVGLTAAILGYFYHISTPQQALDELAHLSEWLFQNQHPHLEHYQRTSNLSFCDASTHVGTGLLDFQLPVNHLHVLEHFYQIDGAADSDELACAKHLAEETDKSYVTGFTTVYQTPSIQQITKNASKEAASLSFTGFGAKFVNLSPKPKLLFWDGRRGDKKLVAEIAPMEAVGTATTPGQAFSISPVYDSSLALQRWVLTADDPIVVYEDDKMDLSNLSPEMRLKFDMHKLNLGFARDYLIKTKRVWLSHFPRPSPAHFMWGANYIGETHAVTSYEPYFIGKTSNNDRPVHLQLSVVSVAPRLFEIEDFLSEYECRHLIQLAKQKGMAKSTVVAGSRGSQYDGTTRSSETTWLSRDSDKVVDRLYRRAAHVLKIPEDSLRHRSEHFESVASHHSLAEDLQVVHYAHKQEYTPHHDFVYPSVSHHHQPTRFATLLFYLHAPESGGETTFPRARQATNHDGVTVIPKRGKAVLFYNLLPDGNVDDWSQHGSNAVLRGDKWVANLWVWDPVID
jgi:prolyl 4-hydroxylase